MRGASLILVALIAASCAEDDGCVSDAECAGARICRDGDCQTLCTSNQACAPAICTSLTMVSSCACDVTHACDTDCACDAECRFCQAADPATTTLTERGKARVEAGPLGAIIEAAGVTVSIPPGALLETVEIRLTVFDEQAIALWPPLRLARAARVQLPPDLWPPEQTGVVLRRTSHGVEYVSPIDRGGPLAAFGVEQLATFVQVKLRGTGEAWALGDYYPARPEYAVIDHGAKRAFVDRCLVPISAVEDRHDPVESHRWAGPGRWQAEAYLASTEVADTAEALDALLRARLASLGDYRLWLNGAWDSSRSRQVPTLRGRRSHHDAGAAVDVVPCRLEGDRCRKVTEIGEAALLGVAADLALEAGFEWVWYEDQRHVHASRASPSVFKRCAAR